MKLLYLQRPIAMSLIAGCFAFFLIVGPKALDPTNTLWLNHGDPLQHYLGWAFFQHSNWSFPPGLNPNFGLDISSSVVFSDSIPIFAILFKSFNTFLPNVFQYFGLWLFLCFVLQAFFALRLMKLVTQNIPLQILGIGFFIFFPPMLWRIGMHAALTGQFLILAALYLNLCVSKPRNIIYWGILIAISASIHFYLFAMVLALFIPFVVSSLKSSIRIIPYAILILGMAVIVMYLCGYFAVGAYSSIGQGYGEFRFNPFALLNPRDWSKILPSNPQFNFDYEGYSYLGLGTIFLIILALLTSIFRKSPHQVTRYIRNYKYLIMTACALTAFSLSNNVWIGQYNFHFPLPQIFQDAANVFRASARFIWPVLYLGIFGAIFIIIRSHPPKMATLILSSCLLIQILDTSAGWIPLRKKLMTIDWVVEDPLKNVIWKAFAQHYKKVVYMPIHCKQEQRGWANITRYATLHHLGTTAVYLARIDCQKVLNSNEQFKSMSIQGAYDESTIYIFDSWKNNPDNSILRVNVTYDLLASIDGYVVLAPGWKKSNQQQFKIDELISLMPIVKRGETISFNNQGVGAKNFLLEGWGSQEAWGTWSIGNSSKFVIAVPQNGAKSLTIKMRAFVSPNHSSQTFNILMNQKLSEKIFINTSAGKEIVIPLSADILTKPYIEIEIESLNPASPNKVLSASNDDRLLGFGLESIQFK